MSDIDSIIAGANGSTKYDFSAFGDPVKSFFEGSKQRADFDQRRAFKDGVPTTADGSPDFGAMAKTLFQKGALDQGVAASNLDLTRQNLKFGQGQSADIANFERGAAPQPTVGPSTSRNTVTIDPSKRPDPNGGQPPQATPQASQPTVMTVLSAQGIPNDQLGAASASVARQLGVDPTAPLNMQDPQVRNVLAPAIQQLKRMGIGQVVPQPGGAAPQQPAPQVAQAPQPQAPQGQPAPVTNAVTTTTAPQTPSRTDQGIAFYSAIMSDPRSPKQNVELAKTRLEALQKSTDLTPDQKNYVQARLEGFKGTMQDFLAENEAGKAGATERAKADVKEQQEYIDQGRQAQARLGTLNTISNIVSSDKKLNLGFGSETTLKVKMALEQAGFDFGDLSGAQLIQKLNGILASESSKSFSTRPTQFEFKTFLANNPGLALDEKGNVRMLGILAQNAKREADLGKLARQNRDNWDSWDNVVEKYDQEHPIKDPTTGKILSNHSIIAPGASQTKAASAVPASYPNARQAPDGNFYVDDPNRPGKYLRVVQ
jgi:hypothetical protein